MQKTSWRGSPTHRRSDSSGSSSNSKDGHTEYSPGRDNLDDQEYGRGGYSDHRSQEHCDDNSGSMYIRPLVKSAYQKIIFLISQPKHMLWVLKRTVSVRRFF